MSKRSFSICMLLIFLSVTGFAQRQDVQASLEAARGFTKQGDYANAVVVLNRAMLENPTNLEVQKDLVFNYYLQHDYTRGLSLGKPLPERADADVQCYQVLGLIYKAMDNRSACEKLYKAGIKKFPSDGTLYNEYGEMLWFKQDYSAIKIWEKGIKEDPSYPSNYYNASKYYYLTFDKVWSLIYGEIFVNMESYSQRTEEIKQLLMESYKKLFNGVDPKKNQVSKNPFVIAYLDEVNRQASALAMGVTPESLSVLRTQFLNKWFEKNALQFPYRLFDYQRQLLKDGLFDAYNEWLFATPDNLSSYKDWVNAHTDEYSRFNRFQKGRVFKMPRDQYYQDASVK